MKTWHQMERLERIEFLVEHGKTMRAVDLSARLGVSGTIIRQYAARHGIALYTSPRSVSDEQEAVIRQMAGKGYSASQIGEVLGLTKGTIIGFANRYGVKLRAPNTGRPGGAPRDPIKIRKTHSTACHAAAKIASDRKRAARGEVVVIPPAPPVPPTCEPVDFLDLEAHHCRFPITDQPPHRFCGAEKAVGSYCAYHATLCFEPAARRDTKHKRDVATVERAA